MSESTRRAPTESDYPATAFFAVYRGHKTGVFPTLTQLIKNIEGYTAAVWEVFNNKAHAENFAKTGVVPNGVTPVKPGAHSSPGARRTTSLAGNPNAGRFAPLASRAKNTSASLAAAGTKSMSALAGASAPAPLAPTKSVPAFYGQPTRAGRPAMTATKSTRVEPGSSRSNPVSVTASMSSIASRTTSGSTDNTDPGLGEEDKVEVWTDGSCLANGKQNPRAAYGVYFGEDDPRNDANRVPGVQTNNRGELLGVIRALEIVDENVSELTIYTDSQYTIKCGVNSSNKPVANYSMIRYMHALMQRRGGTRTPSYSQPTLLTSTLPRPRSSQATLRNNAVDLLARDAATRIPNVPPEVDWDAKRYALEKRPAPAKKGAPMVKTVPSSAVSPPPTQRTPIVKGSIARAMERVPAPAVQPESDEFSEYDNDIDIWEVDESSLPLPQPPVPAPASKPTPAPKPSQGKRARETEIGAEDDEVEDSETERKAKVKAGKRRAVKCPSCNHEFPI
ncbi:hypothetical protein FRC10_012167 [Ceratobasidium sp. 414]|nr:hypothetical protein FRC10_012167 [Ceratobasidium sp. 414]